VISQPPDSSKYQFGNTGNFTIRIHFCCVAILQPGFIFPAAKFTTRIYFSASTFISALFTLITGIPSQFTGIPYQFTNIRSQFTGIPVNLPIFQVNLSISQVNLPIFQVIYRTIYKLRNQILHMLTDKCKRNVQ